MKKMWIDVILIIFIAIVSVLDAAANKTCNPTILTTAECSANESCYEATKTCQCLPDYERINETCVLRPQPPTTTTTITFESTPNYSSLVDNQGNGSIVAGILIPLFLIVFVMCGLYLTRKYKLVAWVRSKLNNRRNENYDEFMIGQDLDDDDPPLH